jgi:hypothetical protein
MCGVQASPSYVDRMLASRSTRRTRGDVSSLILDAVTLLSNLVKHVHAAEPRFVGRSVIRPFRKTARGVHRK